VRQLAMAEIRDAEIRIDMMVMPVEEAYVMLNKFQMTFNDGNAERVDTVSYGWKLLKQQVCTGAIAAWRLRVRLIQV
jgi:dynein heavy chain, axonemal